MLFGCSLKSGFSSFSAALGSLKVALATFSSPLFNANSTFAGLVLKFCISSLFKGVLPVLLCSSSAASKSSLSFGVVLFGSLLSTLVSSSLTLCSTLASRFGWLCLVLLGALWFVSLLSFSLMSVEILVFKNSLNTLSKFCVKKFALLRFGKCVLNSPICSILTFVTFKFRLLAMSKSSLMFFAPFRASRLLCVCTSCCICVERLPNFTSLA